MVNLNSHFCSDIKIPNMLRYCWRDAAGLCVSEFGKWYIVNRDLESSVVSQQTRMYERTNVQMYAAVDQNIALLLSSFKYVAKAIDFDVRNQLGTALRVPRD